MLEQQKMPVILSIDRDPDIGLTVEDLCQFELNEVAVLQAHSPKEGVELAKKNPVDLIILSLFLENSFPADKIIKEIRGLHPQVKVMLFTAHAMDAKWFSPEEYETIAHIKQVGYDAYLEKPGTVPEFVRILKDLLPI